MTNKFTMITDSEEYDKLIGKLYVEDLEKIEGLPPGRDEGDHRWLACDEYLEGLMAFVEANPQYHIGTVTSDGDDAGDYEDVWCESNCIRMVNRESFVLCNGDKDADILLEEVEPWDERRIAERKAEEADEDD